jgi:hypothetical protein
MAKRQMSTGIPTETVVPIITTKAVVPTNTTEAVMPANTTEAGMPANGFDFHKPTASEPTTPLDNFDPFDPARLRLPQSFAETLGVKKLLTTVPVGRPGSQEFFRTHPSPAFRENFAVIELKSDREVYLVGPELLPELASEKETVPVTLFTIISRQGVLRLWPVRLPGGDGKTNAWWDTARIGAETGIKSWVRVKANMELGAYEVMEATAIAVEPKWPELSFREILQIAFKGRLIETADHVVIRRLRGLE